MSFKKRFLSRLLLVMMTFSLLPTNALVAFAAEENINLALNKSVTYSGVEGGKINGNWKYPQFVGEMTVDGDETSRWSADKLDEQWLIVDLESVQDVSQINVNFHAEVPKYKVLVSEDGTTYEEVLNVEDGSQGTIVNKTIKFNTKKVRYIKYQQLSMWLHSNKQKYGSSIYEIEAYSKMSYNATDIAEEIKNIKPTISEDGTSIILPESPSTNYEISLYGCDNKEVVSMDGKINQPISDMDVNFLYTVTNKENPEDFAHTKSDVNLIIPGKYKVEENDNKKPNVVPGLREWKGHTGNFQLTNESRIVIADESLRETAETMKFYFKEMLNKDIEIAIGNAEKSDIYLKLNSNFSNLGKEGYYLNINEYVSIESSDLRGVLYGGISITQILYQSVDKSIAPKGESRDYPKYEVRSGMIDVGRMYIPLEYLQEMTIYMSWFKLNEVQVHVNDYWGPANYSAFRLESETYPMIIAEDGYYTKEAYKNYQKDVKKFGIDVITEIDTPYHAESFRNVPGAVMLKAGALDIREQSTYDIIENLFDEYLDGEDPVIQSDKFHIGTDEYDKAYSEQMRKYTDHFINYVNDKGYETRLWGSLGTRGFKGTTPVSNEAVMNIWAPYWSDVNEMYDAGYDIINTCGGWLYIVPGGNAGYPDRINVKSLYDNFDVNNFSPSRNAGQGTAIMPIAHPQTKGAEFALWNDVTTFRGGFSEFDIFDRLKDAVVITAEKTWYGEKTEGQTSDEFMERIDAVDEKVPGSNPSRFVDSKNDKVAEYTFENVTNNFIEDGSENNYDGKIENATLTIGKDGNSLELSGDGYLSLPMKSIGYPYTVQMDIKLKENSNENVEIFSGKDGILYSNIDGTGKVGFERSGYKFVYDYSIPKNKWVNITLTCDNKNATLFINGKKIPQAANMESSSRKDSTTFVLPLEKIGAKLDGYIDNLNIYNRVLSDVEIVDSIGIELPNNIALNKETSASSVHPLTPTLTPDKSVDGIVSKDSRWASKRATGEGTNEGTGEYGTVEQWLQIDLGKVYKIDRVKIDWEGAFATKYEIQGSLDGEDYFTIKDVTNGVAGVTDFTELGNKEARYIKVLCKEPKTAKYGYSIHEIEIYQGAEVELEEELTTAVAKFSEYTKGEKNGNVPTSVYDQYEKLLKDVRSLIDSTDIDSDVMLELKAQLKSGIEKVSKSIIVNKDELISSIDKVNELIESDYTEESWMSMVDVLNAAIEVKENNSATWQEIDAANEELQKAIDELKLVDKNDPKAALKIAVEYSDEIVANGELEGVVPAVVEEFNEALAEAKKVCDNNEATEGEIDLAFKRLANVIFMLEFKQGNKELLEVLVESTKTLNEKEYTADSWANLQKVLVEVENVLADENAMQDEVNEALNSLKAAVGALVNNNIDKETLEDLVNKVDGLDKDKYIKSTWDNFEKALNDAKGILANEEVTQDKVSETYNNLTRAYLDLRLIPDKSLLEELIQKLEELNKDKYTEETWNVVVAALDNAKSILANEEATQEEVNATIKTLNEAKDSLVVKEETNTPVDPDNGNQGDESNNGNNNGQVDDESNNTGKGDKLPSTGAVISSSLILLLATGAVVTGGITLKKKKREE